jgi:hypothetical protein
MAITLNDCFTTADLPVASEHGYDLGPERPRRRGRAIDPGEADQLMAAFLASGKSITTCPPAYAARSSQYHTQEPEKVHA